MSRGGLKWGAKRPSQRKRHKFSLLDWVTVLYPIPGAKLRIGERGQVDEIAGNRIKVGGTWFDWDVLE
jgi:hypothetical protein